MMRLAITIVLALFCAVAWAADWKALSGRVVGVVDGDTVDVLNADRETCRIRLMGIDAPERRQPFYERAKQHLADLAIGRDVIVKWHKLDNRKSRLVGQVFIDGRDINLALVSAGYAWWYRAYAREQLPSDRAAYAAAEATAQANKAGLWADPDPTPPWDWRKGKRQLALEEK